jgi:hypothetical protein
LCKELVGVEVRCRCRREKAHTHPIGDAQISQQEKKVMKTTKTVSISTSFMKDCTKL